jgi:hypothetical protein
MSCSTGIRGSFMYAGQITTIRSLRGPKKRCAHFRSVGDLLDE